MRRVEGGVVEPQPLGRELRLAVEHGTAPARDRTRGRACGPGGGNQHEGTEGDRQENARDTHDATSSGKYDPRAPGLQQIWSETKKSARTEPVTTGPTVRSRPSPRRH